MNKIIICLLAFFLSTNANAQCGSGQTQSTLNWDYQYKFGAFSNPTRFAIGVNSVLVQWNSSVATVANPVNSYFTGYGAGGYGNGKAFQLTPGNGGVVTFTFDKPVSNLKFALYDIDENQTATVAATNAGGYSVPVTMAPTNLPTTVSVAGSGTNTAVATGVAANTGGAVTTTGVNIDIADPVSTVTLSFGVSTSNIFISDLVACVTGNFSNNYYAAAAPEAGQPAYALSVKGKSVYAVNTATKAATKIFTSSIVSGINSLAYDPYKMVFYYASTQILATNIQIYKYDLRTCTESVFIPDVRTIAGSGVTLSATGMGSAAGVFYDNAYYFGTEAPGATEGHSAVWRLELDNTGAPVQASRVWSIQGTDSVGTHRSNWGDIGINNGTMYILALGSDVNDINHFNMTTQSYTSPNTYSLTVLQQVGMDYLGNIYGVNGAGMALYNGDGTFGTSTPMTGTDWAAETGTVDDASGPFKMPADYGDAPASFGTAYHMMRLCSAGGPAGTLRLGNTVDYELKSNFSALANGDDNDNSTGSGTTNDEDGLVSTSYTPTTYTATVKVISTGTATLSAWLDMNANGTFDAGEIKQIAVTTGTNNYTINWNIGGTLVAKGGAFMMRLRVASAAAEVASPTGMATDGEVEDYRVITANVLPVTLISFDALKEGNTARLSWTTSVEQNTKEFIVERSNYLQSQWDAIGTVAAAGNSTSARTYKLADTKVMNGYNYYRLRTIDTDGTYSLSNVVRLEFKDVHNINVFPNPVADVLNVSGAAGCQLILTDLSGKVIIRENTMGNIAKLQLQGLAGGIYLLKVAGSDGTGETIKIVKK